jgi:hypothetical protein
MDESEHNIFVQVGLFFGHLSDCFARRCSSPPLVSSDCYVRKLEAAQFDFEALSVEDVLLMEDIFSTVKYGMDQFDFSYEESARDFFKASYGVEAYSRAGNLPILQQREDDFVEKALQSRAVVWGQQPYTIKPDEPFQWGNE